MQCCDVFMFVMFFAAKRMSPWPTGTIKLYCVVLYCIVLSLAKRFPVACWTSYDVIGKALPTCLYDVSFKVLSTCLLNVT